MLNRNMHSHTAPRPQTQKKQILNYYCSAGAVKKTVFNSEILSEIRSATPFNVLTETTYIYSQIQNHSFSLLSFYFIQKHSDT